MEIAQLMQKLDITEAEAIQLLEDDKAIDKGAKLFELTDEQAKASKKARQADRAPTVYQFKPRERKVDNDKQMIINYLQDTLKNWFQSNSQCTYNACTNFEIVNPEREFLFTYNGKKYKIVLSAPRN